MCKTLWRSQRWDWWDLRKISLIFTSLWLSFTDGGINWCKPFGKDFLSHHTYSYKSKVLRGCLSEVTLYSSWTWGPGRWCTEVEDTQLDGGRAVTRACLSLCPYSWELQINSCPWVNVPHVLELQEWYDAHFCFSAVVTGTWY